MELGRRSLDTEVLLQPRGFIRCLQWFFAMLAFATCADFSSILQFEVTCKTGGEKFDVQQMYQYPFRLDHISGQVKSDCNKGNVTVTFPGDFSSDAEFFVFTGVVTWLYCFASIGVYVLYSSLYSDEQKKAPLVDFAVTTLLAVFWLASSSAWANGLNGLKNAGNPETWIYAKDSLAPMCERSSDGYVYVNVEKCSTLLDGNFAGANVSVIFGFLNFFLWASNIWFLYKETAWFTGGVPSPAQDTAAAPPTS